MFCFALHFTRTDYPSLLILDLRHPCHFSVTARITTTSTTKPNKNTSAQHLPFKSPGRRPSDRPSLRRYAGQQACQKQPTATSAKPFLSSRRRERVTFGPELERSSIAKGGWWEGGRGLSGKGGRFFSREKESAFVAGKLFLRFFSLTTQSRIYPQIAAFFFFSSYSSFFLGLPWTSDRFLGFICFLCRFL